MASTAPTLTWQMTANQVPVDTESPVSVLLAISSSVLALTGWEVKSYDSSGGTSAYLEIGPTGSSRISSFRSIIAYDVHTDQVLSPHASASSDFMLYMGIAPDGGTRGNPSGSSAVYGAARWSEYWKISTDIKAGAGNQINNVFCIASAEVFSVFLHESSAEDYWGGVCGAIIDPPTDADGEMTGSSAGGDSGRVYGMMVGGEHTLSAIFWGSTTEFTTSGVGGDDPQIGAFLPYSSGSFAILDRATTYSGPAAPRYTTNGGTRITLPVLYHVAASPYVAIGILRQMRKTQDGRMRQIIQDGASVDQSYQVAGSNSVDGDCLSFDNG